MKVLFLDDMEVRHEVADEVARRYGVEMHHARTAEDAIRRLTTEEFDAAALDCDLADEHYAAPYVSGGTAHSGRAVARWIAEHGNPKRVLVHSFNPVGAEEMFKTLSDSQAVLGVSRMPFGPQSFAEWMEWLGRRRG